MMDQGSTQFLLGIVSSIIAGLITSGITAVIVFHIISRMNLRIKRILKSTDKDIDQLIDVYEYLLPANERSPGTDILRWLDEYQEKRRDPRHTLEEYWLVGKYKSRVVSILFFQYYLDSKYLFISYYGVDDRFEEKGETPSSVMLKKMRKSFGKELKRCKGIVYETDAPETVADTKKKMERKARSRLFKTYAKRLGYVAYDIGIDYIAPRLALEQSEYYEEEHLRLSYIPLKKTYPDNIITKDEVLEILHFVYLQVYGDQYNDDLERDKEYRDYLSILFEMYKDDLPDKISLKL